jgi:hypothetical protein
MEYKDYKGILNLKNNYFQRYYLWIFVSVSRDRFQIKVKTYTNGSLSADEKGNIEGWRFILIKEEEGANKALLEYRDCIRQLGKQWMNKREGELWNGLQRVMLIEMQLTVSYCKVDLNLSLQKVYVKQWEKKFCHYTVYCFRWKTCYKDWKKIVNSPLAFTQWYYCMILIYIGLSCVYCISSWQILNNISCVFCWMMSDPRSVL